MDSIPEPAFREALPGAGVGYPWLNQILSFAEPNHEKVNPKLGLAGYVFEVLKFPFRESERTFAVQMQYPTLATR